MDTLNMRGGGYGFYSSSILERKHGHHHYHPYRKGEKTYFQYEFKKSKPPTFDGEWKRQKYAEA